MLTRILFACVLIFSLLLCLAAAEGVARLLEGEKYVSGTLYKRHARLGWLPEPGVIEKRTSEFDIEYHVNERGMHDRPVGDARPDTRIVALGDSHTFAAGVEQDETWPNVLETLLFEGDEGTVWNFGMVGYSVSQYLLRSRDAMELDPQVVLIGFSVASDLYDVIPPSRGGFVYGRTYGRVYHDLTPDGRLIERRELAGTEISKMDRASDSWLVGLRILLQTNSKLYRRIKRSDLAMWAAARVPVDGVALWPGLDTALKVDLNDSDRYRWDLAEAILTKLAEEVGDREVVLVVIPYLPQVYDEVWESSFGSAEGFDRRIASERLKGIAERAGMHFVDLTPPLAEQVRERGRWLHFEIDKHPTPEGHVVIAEEVAGYLQDQGLVPNPPRS